MGYAREAYLLFGITNATARFVEREGSPKYYFSDNGLLNLFLFDRETAPLENEIAVALLDRFGEGLNYVKSSKTSVDVDFYVPEAGLAVQVAYSITGTAREREVGNLVRLADADKMVEHLFIVTKEEEDVIEQGNVRINVVPAWNFLLTECVQTGSGLRGRGRNWLVRRACMRRPAVPRAVVWAGTARGRP